MTRESRYELLTGVSLLIVGILIETLAPPSWPIIWVHGVFAQAAGGACLLDAVVRPKDPPSRVLIGMAMLAYAWMLSP